MIKKAITLFLLLCTLTINLFGQNVFVNYDVKPDLLNIKEPLDLWLNFLETKDDKLGSEFWNPDDIKIYGDTSYFLLEEHLNFGESNFLKFLSWVKVKVLSIRKVQDYYKITSLMEWAEDGKQANVQYIFNVYAGNVDGELKLFNPLEIGAKLYLNNSTVGYIKFHYSKYHDFDSKLAKKQNEFLVNLATNFPIELDTVDYYFAETREEVNKMKGFDFLMGNSGEETPTGKADPKHKIVYANGLNEYYPHEFVHIFLNPIYQNCHHWFNEGVCTYFGGSRGKDLDWHLKHLQEYLALHPEIDLNNMLELEELDIHTGYRYVLGGFFIKKAFEKGSYDLVKEFMQSGKTEEDFYKIIEKHFVKREKLNEWIRAELKKY